MSLSISLQFPGSASLYQHLDRYEPCHQPAVYLIEYLTGNPYADIKPRLRFFDAEDQGLFTGLLVEAVKNIFEHANGQGEVSIEETLEGLVVRITDRGQGFDWDTWSGQRQSSKPADTKGPHGLGLGNIELGLTRFSGSKMVELGRGVEYRCLVPCHCYEVLPGVED